MSGQENGTGKRLMVGVILSAVMFGLCYFLAGPTRAMGEASNGVTRARDNVKRVTQQNLSWFQGGGWMYVAAGGSILILIGTFMGGKKEG